MFGVDRVAMLDHIRVEAYGGLVPLKEVGQVAMKSPQLLSVTVFDPSVRQL